MCYNTVADRKLAIRRRWARAGASCTRVCAWRLWITSSSLLSTALTKKRRTPSPPWATCMAKCASTSLRLTPTTKQVTRLTLDMTSTDMIVLIYVDCSVTVYDLYVRMHLDSVLHTVGSEGDHVVHWGSTVTCKLFVVCSHAGNIYLRSIQRRVVLSLSVVSIGRVVDCALTHTLLVSNILLANRYCRIWRPSLKSRWRVYRRRLTAGNARSAYPSRTSSWRITSWNTSKEAWEGHDQRLVV